MRSSGFWKFGRINLPGRGSGSSGTESAFQPSPAVASDLTADGNSYPIPPLAVRPSSALTRRRSVLTAPLRPKQPIEHVVAPGISRMQMVAQQPFAAESEFLDQRNR